MARNSSYSFLYLLFSPLIWITSKVYSILPTTDILIIVEALEYMFNNLQVFLFSLVGYDLKFISYDHGSVLITGASSAIGGSVAIQLAEQGYTVFAGVNALPDAHRLKTFISPKNHHRLIPLLLDVTNQNHIQHAVQTVLHNFSQAPERERQLVGIINCVGMPFDGPLETISAQDWTHILQVNTVGPFAVISAFMDLLRESRGRVINLSSANTMIASPIHGVYSASKQALENATHTLRNEVFRFGISVSLIIYGAVDTSSNFSRPIVETKRNSTNFTPKQETLYKPLVKSVSIIDKETKEHTVEASVATRAIVHALTSETPKSRYLVGIDSKLTRLFGWVFSDRVLDLAYQVLVNQSAQ
ncbi:hypothetical protein HK103_004338 [Boothiomyces macroporosus]|uniref:Ketoreductase domain-containing protein n=1 Tax=Boothiomyces macroporosus TaxID=261099 RepID=A0AAD5UGS7_9FUNG|nr:hypothetical protein HK103_004338 [Boothiomyces macroporosus]